jgi:hypothetical protein
MKRFTLMISLLFLMCPWVTFAQNIKVSGTVTEQGTNAPVPYASVMLKGTKSELLHWTTGPTQLMLLQMVHSFFLTLGLRQLSANRREDCYQCSS